MTDYVCLICLPYKEDVILYWLNPVSNELYWSFEDKNLNLSYCTSLLALRGLINLFLKEGKS